MRPAAPPPSPYPTSSSTAARRRPSSAAPSSAARRRLRASPTARPRFVEEQHELTPRHVRSRVCCSSAVRARPRHGHQATSSSASSSWSVSRSTFYRPRRIWRPSPVDFVAHPAAVAAVAQRERSSSGSGSAPWPRADVGSGPDHRQARSADRGAAPEVATFSKPMISGPGNVRGAGPGRPLAFATRYVDFRWRSRAGIGVLREARGDARSRSVQVSARSSASDPYLREDVDCTGDHEADNRQRDQRLQGHGQLRPASQGMTSWG